jgi:hypothetical protein
MTPRRGCSDGRALNCSRSVQFVENTLTLDLFAFASTILLGQSNPVPLIDQPWLLRSATPDGVSFAPAASYPVGSNPSGVAVGDFNRDGNLDLAVSNQTSNNVSVLLNNGDGTFRPAVNYAVGLFPLSVGDADFNQDGKLDLITANMDSYDMSLLLGKEDGTFQAARNFSAHGLWPWSVATADFNQDGLPDFAVAINGDHRVNVFLGHGDGTFGLGSKDFIGLEYPIFLTHGDFNGDGAPDLATVNWSDCCPYTLSILLARGDGTFRPKIEIESKWGEPHWLATGDFNKDGNLDLAISGGDYNGPQFVKILLGTGRGFKGGQLIAINSYVVGSIASGDLNADGNSDLVVQTPHSVIIELGNGDGTFTPGGKFLETGHSNGAVTVADLNGDGLPDVVSVSQNSQFVNVLLNTTKP